MRKSDIVAVIAKETGIDNVTVQRIVETLMGTVKESLMKDKNVYLRGFGSFIVKKRAQKTARNISTNSTLIVPEHYIPYFKPSKSFINKVKKSINR